MDIQKLQQDWFAEEKEKIEGDRKHGNRKRKRQYLHFDKRILNLTKDGIKGVWDSSEVARHSFYPFIRFIKQVKKYNKKVPGVKKKTFKLKQRPIDFAAHYDSSIYSWYSFMLTSAYEVELKKRNLSDVPIAYRKIDNKSNLEFASDIITFIKKNPEYTVLTFDVEKFFENIDHLKLKGQWSKLLGLITLPEDHYKVFESLTKYHYVDTEQLHRRFGFSLKDHREKEQVCSSQEFREKVCNGGLLMKNSKFREENGKHYAVGIPQGSSISCLLSNLYMIDFDQMIESLVASVDGLYRRYSDDIIVVIPTSSAPKIEEGVEKESLKINLTLHKEKGEKKHFINSEGKLVCIDSNSQKISTLQYLGIQFDGEDTYLRHAGIAKFQRRRNRTVKHTITTLEEGRHAPVKMFLQKFSYEGVQKGNFLTYANRAKKVFPSKKLKKQVSSNRISKQLKKRVRKFRKQIKTK
jgi:RNA-directed DNA polymerase